MTEELNSIEQQIADLKKQKLELRKKQELEALNPIIDNLYGYLKEESMQTGDAQRDQIAFGKVIGGIVARYKNEFQMKRQPQAPAAV